MRPFELSLTDAATEIAAGRLSPVELTDSVLARVEATEPALGAFACVTADRARADAARAEAEIAAGRLRGPLHGIPLGVKDLFDTAGVPSTASSAVWAGRVPDRDAAVVERLVAAGMVLVGKTHTHEFAFGGETPTTRNPWDTGRIPGGSSGGSGAAVAAGSCTVALGSDTAGSIRIPAALCGTVGLKPTYGRTSRRGVASLSWSLDHVGPLARTVRDCALLLDAMAGVDPEDPATVDAPPPGAVAALDTAGEDLTGVRVGVPTNWFFEHVSADVARAVHAAIDRLAALGAQLREVTVPHAEQVLGTQWGILMPEAAAYHRERLRESAYLLTDDVRLGLEVGELIPATDYIQALRMRTLLQRGWAAMFADVDVLVAPTMAFAAPAVGQRDVTWADGTVEDVATTLIRLTCPADLTGQPALSIPVGFDPAGLPLGMQVIGRPFDEVTVLRVGAAHERAAGTAGQLAPVG